MLDYLFLLSLFVMGVFGPGGSTNCGNLISKDGYRYDLTPLRSGIENATYISLNGSAYTFRFTICNELPDDCGSCSPAAVCQLPSTCNGQFSIEYVDPLLYGIGVGLRYYGGDRAQGYWPRTTYITIYCHPSSARLTDIEITGEEPLFSIRGKSSTGCPARGGYPPSFPFQYNFKKFVYTQNISQGVIQSPFVLDTTLEWKRNQDVYLASSQSIQKYFYPNDHDQYHNLSCYYIDTTDQAGPFELPSDSVFMGTGIASIWDPLQNKFQSILTDQWQYYLDGTCSIFYWFLSGKAIPVQEIDCNGRTTVFYDFQLGQPDGSLYAVPDQCYEFQTCGDGYNTCKDPFCCDSVQSVCVLCDA